LARLALGAEDSSFDAGHAPPAAVGPLGNDRSGQRGGRPRREPSARHGVHAERDPHDAGQASSSAPCTPDKASHRPCRTIPARSAPHDVPHAARFASFASFTHAPLTSALAELEPNSALLALAAGGGSLDDGAEVAVGLAAERPMAAWRSTPPLNTPRGRRRRAGLAKAPSAASTRHAGIGAKRDRERGCRSGQVLASGCSWATWL